MLEHATLTLPQPRAQEELLRRTPRSKAAVSINPSSSSATPEPKATWKGVKAPPSGCMPTIRGAPSLSTFPQTCDTKSSGQTCLAL